MIVIILYLVIFLFSALLCYWVLKAPSLFGKGKSVPCVRLSLAAVVVSLVLAAVVNLELEAGILSAAVYLFVVPQALSLIFLIIIGAYSLVKQ